MCSYLSIQKQITELQQQINFIFTTINNIIERESSTNKNVEELNEKLLTYSGDMLDLINNTLRKQPES
jgi:peptidoglycan hydrolase CwlO-like protein